MPIIRPDKTSFLQAMQASADDSLDFILVVTAAFDPINVDGLKALLNECARALKNGGLLFVQGQPDYLPALGVHLDRRLNFKYWIAIESAMMRLRPGGLPSVHAGLLLFAKGDRFNVRRTRFPHQKCAVCGRPLKDWGGKTHLMHPEGQMMSDVWRSLPPADNCRRLSGPALQTILQMADLAHDGRNDGQATMAIIGPQEGLELERVVGSHGSVSVGAVREPPLHYDSLQVGEDRLSSVGDALLNVVHCGDAVEILKHYPDNSIDLVFADPPYNLDKPYGIYDDERENERYISWCNAWLSEYIRVLKPTGSLYVLNLPRWTMHHAAFLNQRLHFQNWIVWDAMSEPRGKLMPAHYGLLFYTKHPTDFTFNYDEVAQIDARRYCLRLACIRRRKAAGADDKEPLTDIWSDIHRIKHRRDRDYHPCQLPDRLMERIIRLSTNPGDVVLDALSGVGTTAVAAAKLGRRYVAIDLDQQYVEITRRKLAEVQAKGYVERRSVRKEKRPHTKKELQLELRDLAVRLGRLPTPEDVRMMSKYDVQVFKDTFPTWGKALKAAKLEVRT